MGKLLKHLLLRQVHQQEVIALRTMLPSLKTELILLKLLPVNFRQQRKLSFKNNRINFIKT